MLTELPEWRGFVARQRGHWPDVRTAIAELVDAADRRLEGVALATAYDHGLALYLRNGPQNETRCFLRRATTQTGPTHWHGYAAALSVHEAFALEGFRLAVRSWRSRPRLEPHLFRYRVNETIRYATNSRSYLRDVADVTCSLLHVPVGADIIDTLIDDNDRRAWGWRIRRLLWCTASWRDNQVLGERLRPTEKPPHLPSSPQPHARPATLDSLNHLVRSVCSGLVLLVSAKRALLPTSYARSFQRQIERFLMVQDLDLSQLRRLEDGLRIAGLGRDAEHLSALRERLAAWGAGRC